MFNSYTYLYVDDDGPSRQVMQMIMAKAMGIQELMVFAESNHFMERLMALPRSRTSSCWIFT
jgi:hypothetical protein